ncbi:MAG: porin [Pseudomonadota bacterium]
MKKVLFATTALIAVGGMAAADGHAGVTLSGSSRFGVEYTEDRTSASGADSELEIHNRFTLNIDASVDTDSGIEFFSRVRIRGGNEAGEGDTTGASGVSAPRVGMRTGGFTLAVGNILGALESTPGLYSGSVGLTGLSWGNLPINNTSAGTFYWDSFSSAGGGANGVEVIYSGDGFGAHLSHSEVSDETSVNLSYSFGDWTVALGASDATGEDTVLLTVGGSLGAVDLGLKLANVEDDDTATLWGSFDVGAGTTITAYASSGDGGVDDSYGLGFTYSLGGAVLAGGIADVRGTTTADLGVRFSF